MPSKLEENETENSFQCMTASSILNENIKIRDNSLRHFQDDSRLMILNNSKVAGF